MEKILLCLALFPLLTSCITNKAALPPLDVVPHVDLSRYTGRWYEIASFPQSFQKGCSDTQAVYTRRDDGAIEVKNSCFRNGAVDTATGKAWIVDTSTNAKLKVSFFWPFRGDYWIIDLGQNYEYAVVSAPGRNYLWILAREPKMDETIYTRIVARLKERGLDIALLRRTEHRTRTDR
jgi:apolipoprotein D and lipocalin family protein